MRSLVEATYVRLMWEYLSDSTAAIGQPPVLWVEDFTPLRRTASDIDTPATLRYIMWYSMSIRLGQWCSREIKNSFIPIVRLVRTWHLLPQQL